jgi:hypothetical protein
MRLYSDRSDHYDASGQTEPMQPVSAGREGANPPAFHAPRLPVLQSVYYLVATLVLLAGSLGTLAMRFGWFDRMGTQPSAAMATPLMPSPGLSTPLANLLAQDTFARPDQVLWGSATSGPPWQADANRLPAFAIAGHAGTITGGQGFFDALLGQVRASEEVQVQASITRFDGGRVNFGAVLRFEDTNDYYKVYLDGAHLVVMKRVAGQTTVLWAVPFEASGGVSYSLRFRAAGPLLQARAWPTGGREPATWTVDVSDQALATGFGGLRVLLENGVRVSVTAFRELAGGGLPQ